jgi:hypothetical protein
MLFLQREPNFFNSAAEIFGYSGRKMLKRVGNTELEIQAIEDHGSLWL